MSIKTKILIMFVVGAISLSGCVKIKYIRLLESKYPEVDYVQLVHGNMGNFPEVVEEASLPHWTQRERCNLIWPALRNLTSQLGSNDYILLGEVIGSGNAYVNLDDVNKKIRKRAKKEGGNVVLIYNKGYTSKRYSYTTPGYSNTNVYGSVYGNQNYASGYATANTTYSPPQTYSGTHHFPYASGLVFRHAPGVDERRQRAARLNDQSLEAYLEHTNRIMSDKNITYEAASMQLEAILNKLEENPRKQKGGLFSEIKSNPDFNKLLGDKPDN